MTTRQAKVKLKECVIPSIRSRKKAIEKLRRAMAAIINHPVGAPGRNKKISRLGSVNNTIINMFGIARAKRIQLFVMRQEMGK